MRTALLLLLALPAAALADEWDDASKADSVEAYLRYARTHPGTTHAATALRRAEDLGWAQAVAANTALAFEAFRTSFPESPKAAEAALKAEALAWDEAVAQGDDAAFTLFLARYPTSPKAVEAKARIEEAVWHEVRAENTETAYGRYLLRYPQGVYAESAKEAREGLAWQAAVGSEDAGAYEAFLRKYEGGEHTAEARAWLAQVKVSKIEPVLVLVGTWAPDAERAAILDRYRKVVSENFVAGLKRWFTVGELRTADAATIVWGHPYDRYDAAPDTGLLVIEITEARGAPFEPDGFGSDVTARLSLYPPHARKPTLSRNLETATPTRVTGTDASAIHQATVGAVDAVLRSTLAELAQQRRAR